MSWRWLGLAIVACACSAEPVRFVSSGRPTTIVVAQGAGGRRTTVFDRRLGYAEQLELDGAEHQQAWVLEYDATVNELELPARVLSEDPKGLPLPTPTLSHGLNFDGAWSEDWATEGGLPAALSEVRYRETSPCPVVDFSQRHFGGSLAVQPAFAVRLSEERVLVGSATGDFFELGRDEERLLTELSTSTPHQAGFSADDGEIWLLSLDGRVVHGRPETGFAPAPNLPPSSNVWLGLTGSDDGGPLELYAVGSGLEVARYAEGQWTLLDTPGVVDSTRTGVDIAWIERGLVVTIGRSSSELVEHRAAGGFDTIRLQLPIQFNQDAPWKLQRVQGVGVFVGTRYNILHERRDGRWIELPKLTVSPKADVMADLGRGHLASGGNGTLAYWVDGFGYCDPLAFPTGGELRDAVGLPGQLFIFTLDRNEGSLINRFGLSRP